jgi:hypothetical protein
LGGRVRCRRKVEKRLDDVEREREHDRRVLRAADLCQRLQVAQLERSGVASDHISGVAQPLRSLELALAS